MAAKNQLIQTQEKLQTNGDTASPTDSDFHLISLDQKVKRHSLEKKKQSARLDRLSFLGLLLQTGAAAHPLVLLSFHKETEGWKETISSRKPS